MKSVINVEESIGKTVGRRRRPADPFAYGMGLQRLGAELGKSFGTPRYPRGAFKFQSHEEADAWLMKYQIQASLRAKET